MDEAPKETSYNYQLKLLLIDKLALTLVLAVAGYVFSLLLQHNQMKMDYQRILFESRRNSYISLLSEAKKARDAVVSRDVSGNEKAAKESNE